MDDPVGKKKPAFAFWERQRKDSTSSLSSATPSPPTATASSSTSPSTVRRIDAFERGASISPSPSPTPQRSLSQQQHQSSLQQTQHAASSSKSGLSGVQRLIQQYSQSGSGAAVPAAASASASASSSSSSLDRSLSGRRSNAPFSRSSRLPPELAEESARANATFDSPAARQAPSAAPGLIRQPSTSSNSVRSTSRSTHSSATPTSRLSVEAVASHPAAAASSASPIASTSQSDKETDAEKARRRRRLVQEQLRRRNSKRRSAGAIDMTESPIHSDDDHDDEEQDHLPPPIAASASSTVGPPAASGPPNLHTRTSSASSRREHLNSESNQDTPLATRTDSAETDAFHDAQSHPVTPPKVAANLPTSSSSNVRRNRQGRPPSFEDTRPWLEFSPVLPDSELFDSPDRPLPQSFSLLHQSASSDMSASASQSSVATDPTAAASLRPSPSRSNSASLVSSDSPRSPTGLGFSTPPGYPSAASYLSIHSPTHASHTRAHRTTKLPPPRPSPQAPLPPPPSIASSTVPSSPSRGAGAPLSSLSAGSRSTTSSASSRNNALPFSLQDELDRPDGQNPRSRSYSLEQEVASAEQQLRHMSLQSAATSSSAQSPLNPASGGSAPPATASTLAVPMIRQRSDSLQRKDRDNVEPLESTSRPSRASPPTSTPPIAAAAATSSRGTSSTVPLTGRPRGFTVGAVPGASQAVRGSAPVQTSTKSRPRSLLSNEVFPLDLAEPRYKSNIARQDHDNARKNYSMDVDRRSPSYNSDVAGSASRGISSASTGEREGLSSSSDRLTAESSDRRPSIGGRSRSGSSASLLQQVNSQPKSHASFVIAVVGHAHSGKSTVIKKGLRQFGLSKPHVLSEKVTSHSTVCVVDQEQRTIEVLEVDASVLLNGPSKRFTWPKFLPHIDAVILCYDASEIASFRGMSELLENFSVANLSTVMLACKSEVHPKAVDPYYASDMACIYNVGLAECTVQSEEGKKRMRDCFSYLVKEVAKARSGRARRGTVSTVPPAPAAMTFQRSQSPGAPVSAALSQNRAALSTSQGGPQISLPPSVPELTSSSSDAASGQLGDQLASPAVPVDLLRTRGYSNASSSAGGAASSATGNASTDDAGSAAASENAAPATDSSAVAAQNRSAPDSNTEMRLAPRKMSSATVASGVSDVPSLQSDEDGVLHGSLQRAQMGLQNARSSGGYVSIDELWDKLFHAAISRTDERFVSMFMVFYRGFATPLELLKQMMARFETLTAEDVADGLVHRFALVRLTNMLGDWVLDYPGDLSHPETHALLVRYHRQLLRHPDTVHTASQIHAAVDATAYAPDLDTLWSKTVNTDQTRHKGVAAAMAAIASTQQQQQQGGADAHVDGAGMLPASHSNGSTSGYMPSSGNTSHDFGGMGHAHGGGLSSSDVMEEHERTGSESSLPTRPDEFGAGGRSRSASDLTTSSVEGADAFYNNGKPSPGLAPPGGSGVSPSSASAGGTAGSASATSSTAQLVAGGGGAETVSSGTLRALDQKAALRSISNVLMEVDDEVIATELTRLEWSYFTAIQPRDLLRHILVPHDKRDGPVSRSISHFNYVSNWVCSMILVQSKTKHRARMLEKFFNIASILRHDNNYGSLNSVLGGLSKTAVHRLRQTRELLKGKAVNKAYQSLVRLMSNERSSAAYRLALENSDGPTIPYVGVHLQDIISISDGNPSKRASDGMIHWRKFSLMDEAVMAVAKCQQYDRFFKPNPPVERLIVDVPVLDDEALYERSLLVEPRTNDGNKGSKIKDLKTFLSNHQNSSGGGGIGSFVL